MTADGTIYRSERLADAYAFSRPPVHRHVLARLAGVGCETTGVSATGTLRFRARFPSQGGYSLDLTALPYRAHGLDLVDYEAVEVEIRMSSAAYVDYLLGDAGVELALAHGQRLSEIRRYCEEGVSDVFSAGPREVVFEAQIACVRHR